MKPSVPLTLLSLSATLAASGATAAPLSPADLYARLAPSVWRVQTYDEDGLAMSVGSAVVIAPDALVTNCHVLANAHRVVVRHDRYKTDARLEMWDPERDLCRIRAGTLGAPAVALGDDAAVRTGQAVYTLGNPRGLDLTMSSGLLSSIRHNEAMQTVLLQTSAPISSGSSGGGLFDDQGRLIGVTTLAVGGQKAETAQNLNFAVPAGWVAELPRRHAQRSASKAGGSPGVDPSMARLAPLAATGTPAAPRRFGDESRLPFANDKMREAYRRFLALPLPRAFVVGENGSFRSIGFNPQLPPRFGLSDVAQAALLECQRISVTRCHVYAVDESVVYAGPD